MKRVALYTRAQLRKKRRAEMKAALEQQDPEMLGPPVSISQALYAFISCSWFKVLLQIPDNWSRYKAAVRTVPPISEILDEGYPKVWLRSCHPVLNFCLTSAVISRSRQLQRLGQFEALDLMYAFRVSAGEHKSNWIYPPILA
ncbi:hypothetical protein Q1695_009087 [Nippostrongylus brasiliensis]|nr:hypothetical protein Q1695_009087 [Nippostrongylus brasiliensis]